MFESPQGRQSLKILCGGVVLGIVVLAALAWGMKTTDSRPFCSSCHIMTPEARTHKMSSHANLTCNECHAPHVLISKLPFKAMEGTRDFFVNTIGTKPDVVAANTSTKDVVNANCKSCHVMTNTKVASMEAKTYCTDCHRGIGHMRMQPISTRMVADE